MWNKKLLFIARVVLVLSLLVGSCTSKVSVSDEFDDKLPFAMNISNNLNDQIEVQPGSERHGNLIKWLEKNSSGWESSIASYNTDISLNQNDFRLLYSSNGLVVIGFIDNSGEIKQFTKTISEGELDFLLKD